ncbi:MULTISPECIES: polyprenyl synthetase family protein [unclassified Enterococcus]|uniref:polyprenyl synthetase family protein n=1 Tax=unclassified Enterococcus TaxID=2608891 RepID=UPI001CE0CE47|nr:MULTISPECIES: polyprenyl synthetase family protein [unclassified Enterococcus]MCA5013179.1 polyprenyl synthetase family protein [Enterococcus sp. S23]MCA5016429.1 polyprenyl synthetase family protein [Enterococcus sp. S22(2020)]
MNEFWKDFPVIQQQLNETCDLIKHQVKVRNKDIEQALIDLTCSGGKLLRPAFFFLFAQIGDKQKQDHQQLLKIAASIEILHMATLVHDDIIDDSPLRRGAATIQSRYGKDIAVYTGDLLFTEFFELLADTMNGSDFLHTNAAAMKRLLLGELDQMHTRYKKNITVFDYLRSVNGKTAELFSLSCLEGAHFGYANKEIQRLAARIGRNIGIAFQVYDDILDYSADSKTLKKPVLEDLAQGVYTLPLIFAIQKAPEHFYPYLEKKSDISIEEAIELGQLVHKYDGVIDAKNFAKKVTEKALIDIQKLPDCLGKNQLEQLTQLLLQRSF